MRRASGNAINIIFIFIFIGFCIVGFLSVSGSNSAAALSPATKTQDSIPRLFTANAEH
jgi:hypothetical protein